MSSLDDIAIFVEVVRARSFSQASVVTGIPASTLSRRIAELEKHVGLRLLHRTTRRVEPSAAGKTYYERCRRIVEEARLAHEELVDVQSRARGLLRVSMPADFANLWAAPLLGEFAKLYPEVDFELDISPRRADLVAEGLDVAIRIGEQPDSNLVAHLIARFSRSLYAAPAWVASSPDIVHPNDLTAVNCLRLSTSPAASHWILQRGNEVADVVVHGRFAVNAPGMLRIMSTQGHGVALLADGLTQEDVKAGRLVRVLPDWEATSIPIFAMTETRLLPARTQLFIDFLRERLKSS